MAFRGGVLQAAGGRRLQVREHPEHKPWIGWLQGEVSSIINFLVSVCVLVISSFHLVGIYFP